MKRPSLAAALSALVLAACGGSDQPAKTGGTTTAKMSSGDDSHALCVQFFQRQRECTDTYIPALVAMRVELDKPPGIAQTDQEIGRDALVAKAMEEWASDSTDEAISATCEKILADEPSQAEIEQGRSCMAADACQPFVDCALDLVKSHMH
jgi:hypothetical protein